MTTTNSNILFARAVEGELSKRASASRRAAEANRKAVMERCPAL